VLMGLNAAVSFASTDPRDAPSLPSRPILLAMPAPDASPVSERLERIEQWTRDYSAWKTWFEQWRNRREPGWWGTRPRRDRPDPPASLVAVCPVPSDETGVLNDACRLLAEWRTEDVATAIVVQQQTSTRAHKEATLRSAWWQHVHLDALWPMTQGTSGVFGLVGLHTTIAVSDRVQVFLAPGAILMRVPGVSGNQEWKPATHWGFSYRVVDFTVAGMRRPVTLHANLAKI
jgi:hypothetical protein